MEDSQLNSLPATPQHRTVPQAVRGDVALLSDNSKITSPRPPPIVLLNVGSHDKTDNSSLLVSRDSDDESTAGEILPAEESTTDPGNMTAPIHAHSKLTNTYMQNQKVTLSAPRLGLHQYENWSMMINISDENNKRGRLKRTKGSRVAVRLRDRAPQPLPRPSHLKVKFTRACPIVRKRRSSARARPQVSNTTSEGDMAQADEMGEDGEREKDDGFVDGPDNVRRRIKKKPTGLHALVPSISTASPPSSPSNTPISRRRSASRKSRTKPRTRKPPTRSTPTPASADISTQDTTTPGPCSSDTTEEDCTEAEGITMSSVSLEGRKISSSNNVPQKPSAPVTSRFTGSRSVSKPIPSRPNGLKPVPSQNGNILRSGNAPVPLASRPIKRTSVKNSSVGSQGSQTSDAEHTSTSTLSGFTPNLVRRRIESDLSTAPLSSETSDLETSGNEKIECGTKDRYPTRPPPPPKATIKPTIGRNNVVQPSSGGKMAPQSRPPVSRKPESVYGTSRQAALADKRVASTVAAHGDSSASSPEISQPQRRVQPVAPGPLTKTGRTVPPKPGANIPSKPSKPPVPPKSKPEVVRVSKPSLLTQQKQQNLNQQEKDKKELQIEKPLPQQEKRLQDKQQNGHKSVKDLRQSSRSSTPTQSVKDRQQSSRSSTPTRSVKKGKDSVSQKDIKDAILKKSSVGGIQRRGSSPVTSRTPSVTLRPQRSYSAKTSSHRLSTPNLTVETSSLKGAGAVRPGSGKNAGKTNGSKPISKALQRFSVNLGTDSDKCESSLKNEIRKQPSTANKPLRPAPPTKRPPISSTKTTNQASKPATTSVSQVRAPQLKDTSKTTEKLILGGKTVLKNVPQSSTSSSTTSKSVQKPSVAKPVISKVVHSSSSSDHKSSSEGENNDSSQTPTDAKVTSPPPPERPPRRRRTAEKDSINPPRDCTSPLLDTGTKTRRPPPEPPAKLRASKSPNSFDTISPPPPPSALSPTPIVVSPPAHVKSPPCSPSVEGSSFLRLLKRKPRNYEEYVPSSGHSSDAGGHDKISWPLERENTDEEIERITGRKITHVESVPNFNSIRDKPALSHHNSSPSVQLSLPPRSTRPSLPGMVEEVDGPGIDDSPAPPIPPRNFSVDELFDLSDSSSVPLSRRESSPRIGGRSHSTDEMPPPLPSQPIPKRKFQIGSRPKSVAVSSTTTVSPPILIHKDTQPSHPPIHQSSSSSSSSSEAEPAQSENVYEEIPGPVKRSSHQYEMVEFLPRKPTPTKKKKPVSHEYDTTDSLKPKPPAPLPSNCSRISLSSTESENRDSPERRFSASICVTSAYGLSPVAIRRANSDRLQHRIPSVTITPIDFLQNRTLKRTPSMDTLDARMNQSMRVPSISSDWSGDEEDERQTSPHPGLPQLPTNTYQPPTAHEDRSPGAPKKKFDPEDEPLYQYLNHTEFSVIPRESTDPKSRTLPAKGSNQLEIARQLSINHRKLWSEQPEVIESGILKTISDQERKLQEAMFEVITSEASYLRSLTVLIEQFMDDAGMNPNLPDGRRVLDRRQHHVIFSNVKEVFQSSTKFLHELHQRQRESAIIQDICDIILKYAEDEFGCYITYCTNQVYQMRELTTLIENSIMFKEYMKRLESHRRCQNLNLQSFLLLPMQRITRMPLLILAILNRTPLDHPNHDLVEKTLRTVQKLVTACNDGARRMERTEELHSIYHKLDFGKIKPFPLVSVTRQLERKGTLLYLQAEQRLFVKPKIKQTPYYVFVFTDYVILTKKKKSPKGEDVYRVVDFASKAVVEVQELEVQEQPAISKQVFGEQEALSRAMWLVSTSGAKNAFHVTFLDNSAHKTERYILIAQNTTDRTRWLEAIKHPQNEKVKEDEKIYESWDCPQVQAVFDYHAQQPDELSLVRGDVVKVYRKMADGWYEGERLRDLEWGWFPSNFAAEIENEHTRARNLKERHRLLSVPDQQFTSLR